MDNYILNDYIGKGSIGKVYTVYNKLDKQIYAMKMFDKNKMLKMKKIKRIMTEREILSTTYHPFIIHMINTFQTDDKIYFVMEYCSKGNLYKLLKRQPNHILMEKDGRFYLAEILIGLEYLHSQGYIYRDLKPENILISNEGHIKLADFDLSKAAIKVTIDVLKNGFTKIKPVINTNSLVGTMEYLSPEIIKGYGYSSEVDWWTYGVLMYEMFIGYTPFIKDDIKDIEYNILNYEVTFPKTVKLSKKGKNLIISLLHKNVKKRLGYKAGASEIKSHQFFSEIKWYCLLDTETPNL